jgi:DNA-binding XRE family transcriptional regulator
MSGKLASLPHCATKPASRRQAAALLRKVRHKLGLSQEQAARIVGVSCRSYGAWERGDVPMPHLEALIVLENQKTSQNKSEPRAVPGEMPVAVMTGVRESGALPAPGDVSDSPERTHQLPSPEAAVVATDARSSCGRTPQTETRPKLRDARVQVEGVTAGETATSSAERKRAA